MIWKNSWEYRVTHQIDWVFVDFKKKVLSQYRLLILKRNFQLHTKASNQPVERIMKGEASGHGLAFVDIGATFYVHLRETLKYSPTHPPIARFTGWPTAQVKYATVTSIKPCNKTSWPNIWVTLQHFEKMTIWPSIYSLHHPLSHDVLFCFPSEVLVTNRVCRSAEYRRWLDLSVSTAQAKCGAVWAD